MERRNFAIIAHIDHGKSTLADRMLELCGAIKTGSGEQLLDTMDLEKERGITIKLNPARMNWTCQGVEYQLNLIDTPGHADFQYEVSRSLSAVEGAILIVDSSQNVQAQTLTHLSVAKQLKKVIIPVINKIDLPHSDRESTEQSIISLLGDDPNFREDDICYVSGKTGEGVDTLLDKIVERIPPASKEISQPARALVFDSFYDSFLGVVAYVSVFSGRFTKNDKLQLMGSKANFGAIDTGYLQVTKFPSEQLQAGEIGYIATGLKRIADCRVGDTIIRQHEVGATPFPGYQPPKPMVFASLFADPDQATALSFAMEKLALNDASLVYQPIRSTALGAGYQIGCLGLLHMEIVKERLEREYNLNVLVTTPRVGYRQDSQHYVEPWATVEVVCPEKFYGPVLDLSTKRRFIFDSVDNIGDRLVMKFQAPMAELITDYYDRLKSITSGYGSLDYQPLDERPVDLVFIDLLLAGEKIDALREPVIRLKAQSWAKERVEKLRDLIPKHNFEISIQAAIDGKIIARADISPMRKDVTAKLYGGDVTRKRKLLEKQKSGKKKMKQIGRVSVPSSVFVELMKNG